jgi:hypothetical protein
VKRRLSRSMRFMALVTDTEGTVKKEAQETKNGKITG